MATPGELVFMGREGTGAAQVFGSPKDPLAIYMAGRQQQAANELNRQKLALQQRKDQTGQLQKALGKKYEDPGDRFRAWARDRINQTNQSIFSLLQGNPDADLTDLTPMITEIQGQAEKDIAYTREINNIFEEKMNLAKSMDYVDQKEFQRILGSIIQKDDPYEVDRDKLENVEQIPAIYDLNSIVADSVENIKTQFSGTSTGDPINMQLGQFMEIVNNKKRFRDIEATMDFLLGGDDVTELGQQMKVNGGLISDRIRWDIAKSEVADPTDDDAVYDRFKEIQYDPDYRDRVRGKLRSILEQFDQSQRDVRLQSLGRHRQPSVREQEYLRARQTREADLNALVNPYKDGKPTQQAQTALGKLRGGDFMGGTIVDARLKSGGFTLSPEFSRRLAETMERNQMVMSPGVGVMNQEVAELLKELPRHLVPKKGHKVLITTKTGTLSGEPFIETDLPLDLSDPAAKTILNAIMNKNPGERKVYYSDLFAPPEGGFLDETEEEQSEEGFLY